MNTLQRRILIDGLTFIYIFGYAAILLKATPLGIGVLGLLAVVFTTVSVIVHAPVDQLRRNACLCRQ